MPRILYIQYTNPAGYPPLEHSSRILANNGWDVLFLGTGSLGSKSLCFPPHNRITVKQLSFCPQGWKQKLHYLWFCLWIIYWAFRFSPQWVYASDVLSCPIALLLSLLLGTKIAYHEHDSPTTTQSDSTVNSICLKTRKWLTRRAQMCILPNQERIKQFTEETNSQNNILCVWNCPAQEEAFLPPAPYNNNDIWLWYHGSIVPTQIPPTVVSALAILPTNVKLRIAGYETVGHLGYVQQLRELAEGLGISERLEFLGSLPTRNQLFDWCRKCNVGISLFPHNSVQPMPGASNKAFDYLACGLALLVSDLPDWMQMYVDPGYGQSCNPDDPKSIADAVNNLLINPEQMRQMGESGRRRILEQWNYEQQFMEIYKIMCL